MCSRTPFPGVLKPIPLGVGVILDWFHFLHWGELQHKSNRPIWYHS